MSKTYDIPEEVYGVEGWSDGGTDCEPPEAGKFWLTITEDGEEFAIIVHRKTGLNDAAEMRAKVNRARWITSALNQQFARDADAAVSV